MENSSLWEIKDAMQQFAEATSAALKVDVEIIDKTLYRIAGTGKSKDTVGQKIQSKGIINRYLFNGQRKIIVENPGQDENCILCPKYGKCMYKTAVYAILQHENETIGVIGIIAMDDEQADLIKYNNYAMLDFVDKIANLITTKVKEHQMFRQLNTYAILMNTILDNINKGLIILNKDYKIIDVNNFLIEKLSLKRESVVNQHILQVFPSLSIMEFKGKDEYQEITYNIKGDTVYLLCVVKPIVVDERMEGTICLIEDYKDTKKLAYTISEQQGDIALKDIIGTNAKFVQFKEKVRRIAINDSTVLLTGETGTGKELFARAIHAESNRKKKPFIAINCGALPETLIESELFGYEKGAFTGASSMGKHGKFYLADKGTIFLDEIETMPLYLQPTLLRVIENREIERIGGAKPIPINVRIIAATNIRIDEMVKKGQFREDLFHRLNVVTLFIPTLKERGNDILVLADYFIEKFSVRFNKKILGLTEEVKEIFLKYSWKGNVRELQNTIEYAINMEQSNYITKENLPFQIKEQLCQLERKTLTSDFETLEMIEKKYIKKALDECGWSETGRVEAAKRLGISRATVYRKIKKYSLNRDIST